jgi:hypothetical protein
VRPREEESPQIERVQTGVRMEKGLVKILKALAQFYDLSLGELLELMARGWLSGSVQLSPAAARAAAELARIYDVDLAAEPGLPVANGGARA